LRYKILILGRPSYPWLTTAPGEGTGSSR